MAHGADSVSAIREQLRQINRSRNAVAQALREPGADRERAEQILEQISAAETMFRNQLRALSEPQKPLADRPALQRCPVCMVKLRPLDDGTLKAHLDPTGTGRYCSGGAEPTDAQRRQAQARVRRWKDKSAGSVRAISAGLPTLGKRR